MNDDWFENSHIIFYVLMMFSVYLLGERDL